MHSLRHAYASLMIEAGVNLKRLQILMGHSSFRVTMDTYAHLVPDVRDDAVNRLAEIVLSAPKLEPLKESGSKMVAKAILSTSDEVQIDANSLMKNGPGRIRTVDEFQPNLTFESTGNFRYPRIYPEVKPLPS